ncbi:helix-turn-helix transcriptional regulator [Paenibacillus filicis]|uniref:Helix-turn-helix transcriptional regulator n=1 Tax=Paenibacillus filicis TaxID=669464 RepID=A0ABU9DXK1_9BACL
MPTRRVIKSNLKELLIKHKMDQKTLHQKFNVREATIGETVKDENKTFTRENLNGIIQALDTMDIKIHNPVIQWQPTKKRPSMGSFCM